MAQYHVGVDLHKTIVQICVLDPSGKVLRERRFAIPDREAGAAVLEWLGPFMAEGRLAVEALGCNRWFVNACLARRWDVLVANAAKLALKQQGKKTDRRDAFEIARRLFLGDLDRVARTYFPTDEEYGQRKVARVEQGQVERRTRTIAEIRGLLNAYKLVPPMRVLWTAKGIAWVRAQALPTEDLTFSLQVLAGDLESVQARIVALKKRIVEIVARDEVASRFQKALPAAGPQTALMVKAELGDARRFKKAQAVASYLGAVPRVTASADKSHHGRMTKCGNAHLRWIVGQWAVRLLARDETARLWAGPMYRRMHKNKVRVALARRLIIGVWVMCTRGEAFSLERCLGFAA